MTSDNVKAGLMLAAAAVGVYAAWRAYQASAGVVDSIGGALTGAYDAVAGVLTGAAESVASLPEAFVTAVHGPAVPVGGSSVQQRHTTDLPEGSSRAAEMYWSLYPDAVFYD